MKSLVFWLAIGLSLIILVRSPMRISTAQEEGNRKSDKVPAGSIIIEEKGPAGHSTIGISEEVVVDDSQGETALTFKSLMAWEYDEIVNPPPPEDIRKLNGRKVRLVGFMYPLQEGAAISYFCLLRTTQTCCYGPQPQFNQYVFVEMKRPTQFYRLDPVSCVGTLKVEPSPEEGYIYRMEGNTCAVFTR